jgi:prophage tail gpP-like protein
MADPALLCEVRTEGGIYRDWLSVVVTQSFDDKDWNVNFRLICAEPSVLSNFRLKPKDRVEIALAGQVVVAGGYIVNRQTAYDANRHAVQIDGYSKAGQLAKVSINEGTGQYRGYTLDAIANSVLKPYGTKFRMEGPPDGANEKFNNVMVRWGESPFALISRLCNQRGMWLISDKNGDLVAVGEKAGGGNTVTFVEGQNILAANASISMPHVYEVIAGAQTSGSDTLFGKKAAEIQAKAEMSGGPEGHSRKILAEMPLTENEAKLRTDMEVKTIQASLFRVTITYAGWLKPGVGGLWDLGDVKQRITVKSPMLLPVEGGQMEMVLWGYTYTQDANGGTTTTVELVDANAFAAKAKLDSRESNFLSNGSSPAQPEQPT